MSHLAYIRKQLNKIIVEIPYSSKWILAVQHIIPANERSSHGNIWSFHIKWHEAIEVITKHYYHMSGSLLSLDDVSPSGWEINWTNFLNQNFSKSKYDNQDDYRILFLLPNAPISVVKAVYKSLVKVYHPDVSGGHDSKFIQIDQAYKRIINGQKEEGTVAAEFD